MSENRYAIALTARNDASKVFDDVGNDAKRMGTAISAAAGKSKGELLSLSGGAKSLASTMQKSGADSERAFNGFGSSLKALRTDFDGAAGRAKNFWANVDSGKEKVEGLNRSAETIRNFGLGLGAAGIGGLMLSKNLIRVSEEGRAVEARLESILKQQGRLNDMEGINKSVGDIAVKGHFADDDEIRDAAVKLASFNAQTKDMGTLMEWSARQARTMGTDIGGVAEQLGKVYGTGAGVAGLKRSGVTIDQKDIDAIEAAYKMSKEMGQQKFMDIIGPAIVNNTVALADSLTATEAAANDAKRAMDDFQTAAGKGAANAQKSIDNLGTSVLGLVSSNPKLAEAAGLVGTFGAYGLTAAGGLATFVGGIGQAYLAVNAFKLARDAEAVATAGATLATDANTLATVASGNAALVASVKFKALALAKWAGVAGAGIFAGAAIYDATRGEDEPGAMEAAGNVWARLTGGEVTEADGKTKSQKLDEQIAVNSQDRQQKALKSQLATLGNMGSFSVPSSLAAATITTASDAMEGAGESAAKSVHLSGIQALSKSFSKGAAKASANLSANVQDALRKGARIMGDGSIHIPDFTINTDAEEGELVEHLVAQRDAATEANRMSVFQVEANPQLAEWQSKLANLPKGKAFNSARAFYKTRVDGSEADARREGAASSFLGDLGPMLAGINNSSMASMNFSPRVAQPDPWTFKAPSSRREQQARTKSMTYDSNGDLRIKFDDIVVPGNRAGVTIDDLF